MILSCVLFLVSFGWFAAHAVPSVYFGDNGELLAAIHTGGIPHPTGFPLFILLSTLPSHYGTLAVNLVSSACGALAVVWIARTAHSLFGRAASVPAAVVLLGSCTLTLQAASARVYTCQLAAMAAVMLVAASFKPERRWGLLFGFLLGLSAGTHVLFLGGLVFTAVLLLDRRREIIPLVPWIAGALMIGASVLLWIPLRSSLQPVINWGEPSHGSRWWLYITQSSYRSKMFSRGFDGTGLFLREFLRILRFEWNPVVWLLFLPGWGTLLFAKNRRFAYALGLTALFYLALLYSYGGEYDLNVLDRYFLPLTALAALWVGNGWVWLWERWIPAVGGAFGSRLSPSPPSLFFSYPPQRSAGRISNFQAVPGVMPWISSNRCRETRSWRSRGTYRCFRRLSLGMSGVCGRMSFGWIGTNRSFPSGPAAFERRPV